MKFTNWMTIREGWFGGPKVAPELQDFYASVQKDPKLSQELQQQLAASIPIDQALQNMSAFNKQQMTPGKQLQSFQQTQRFGQQPRPAPETKYTGLDKSSRNSTAAGKDLTPPPSGLRPTRPNINL